jgi:hypothetical protein
MSTRVYKIKHFISTDDKDLDEALSIYVKETPACILTNSNDIYYWVDNYNLEFKPDQLFCLGFYLNNKLIGFAQFIHFIKQRLIIVDYMAIKKEYRDNSSFFVFVAEIKNFIESKKLEFDYIVTEIAYMNHLSNQPSNRSQALIRLLKAENFRVIKAGYIQPMLGDGNLESEMKAVLMLYSKNDLSEIKNGTYLSIVNDIYYNHYLRWYTPLPSLPPGYKKNLDKMYLKIKTQLPKGECIEINGHHYLFKEETAIPPKYPDIKSEIILMLLFSGALGITFSLTKVRIGYIVLGFILPMFTYACIYAVRAKSKEASGIVNKLIAPLKFFGKSE